MKNQVKQALIEKYDWPQYYHGSPIIFAFFIGYVVYWYLQGSFRFPILGTIRFEFIMGATLSAFAIPAYFTNPNRERSNLGSWVSVLFLIMIIMVIFSYVPNSSSDIFINRVIKFALLGFFIAAFVTTPRRLAWFIGAFMFTCLKMGQEGFVGTITGSLLSQNQGTMRLWGTTPNYIHPNSFSGMAVGCLPFIYYFLKIVPWHLRLVLLVQLVFMVDIIIFTGSRTGYIALVFALLFLIWKSKNRIRTFFLFFLIGLAITPLIPHDYIERAQTIFTQKDKEGNSTGLRKEIIDDAWEVFLDNPLGVGVGAFPAVRLQRFGRDQDTHNLYLEIATNLGVQGLIVFAGFIFALLRTLSRLAASISHQIKLIEQISIDVSPESSTVERLQDHLRDLQIMYATSMSVYAFILFRLCLGLFGMDLYEIYWWFALGTTVAVWNINVIAQSRTNELCGSICSTVGSLYERMNFQSGNLSKHNLLMPLR